MAEILVQMENVLKIANTSQALSMFLLTHVGNLSGENRSILQVPIYVQNVTIEQCNEAM